MPHCTTPAVSAPPDHCRANVMCGPVPASVGCEQIGHCMLRMRAPDVTLLSLRRTSCPRWQGNPGEGTVSSAYQARLLRASCAFDDNLNLDV